jgi:hypothetical protein
LLKVIWESFRQVEHAEPKIYNSAFSDLINLVVEGAIGVGIVVGLLFLNQMILWEVFCNGLGTAANLVKFFRFNSYFNCSTYASSGMCSLLSNIILNRSI